MPLSNSNQKNSKSVCQSLASNLSDQNRVRGSDRSLARADIPCRSIGTTVWSR